MEGEAIVSVRSLNKSSSGETAAERKIESDALRLLMSSGVVNYAQVERGAFQQAVARLDPTRFDRRLSGFVKMANAELFPRLLALHEPSRIPPAHGESLCRNWLGSFVLEFACTQNSLRGTARKYAKALVREATAPYYRVRYILPFLGLECAREFSIKGVHKQYRYRLAFRNHDPTTSPELLGFYAFPRAERLEELSRPDWSLAFSSSMVLIDVVVPKNQSTYVVYSEERGLELQVGLVTALRLFQAGKIGTNMCFVSRDLLYLSGASARHFSYALMSPGGVYKLNEPTISRFRRFWRWFDKFLPTREKLPQRVILALSYFNSSYTKSGPSRFLDLHIALEALLDVDREQTLRLPLRAAALLERTQSMAVETFELVKALWNTRCKIAHGAPALKKPKFAKRVEEQTPKLEAVVRRAIVAHIKSFERLGSHEERYEAEIKSFDVEMFVRRGLRK